MAAPQQGNQNDHSANILWGVAAFFATVAGVWFAFKPSLITFYFSLKIWEIKFISLFVGSARFEPLQATLHNALLNPAKLTFADVEMLGTEAGSWIRIPFAIILFILAIIVYFGNTTREYKRRYNMQELANLEQQNWPQIMPVLNQNLLKTDIDKGPWAMAMTPLQFCKRKGLLEEVNARQEHKYYTQPVEVRLRRGLANQEFALQLGPLWKSIEKLPPHIKALFAAFAARINADSKAAENLLMQLNKSSLTKLDLTGVDELLKKHASTKPVQRIVHSHAYVMTVMASMLEGAREDGVQASADFLWVKPIDRRLWYTLNTVGRQTPFVEVAGIFAHWIAEKEAGKKLLVPNVEEATKALEIALSEVIYRPEEVD